ncbi:hypothetical protein [Saccharothrix australiensis]|uniref:Uncharacterized protein n=1 Tax=Saccharothrix australiensis TaxID=2072 RepID=A0A495VVN5_9PSEU|nr:hypothetical protein [Saccharothrix australiensis]RKT51698.1 hypothetical protein C8E97_0182 [Saccharothrix australiensis]
MHGVRELIDAYGPALLALLAFLVVWRLARSAFLVWSGQDAEDEEEPAPRSAVDGARGSMGWAVARWLLLAVVLAGVTGFGLFWLLGRPALPSGASFTTAELPDLLKIGLAVVDVLCGYLRAPYPEDDRTERTVRFTGSRRGRGHLRRAERGGRVARRVRRRAPGDAAGRPTGAGRPVDGVGLSTSSPHRGRPAARRRRPGTASPAGRRPRGGRS